VGALSLSGGSVWDDDKTRVWDPCAANFDAKLSGNLCQKRALFQDPKAKFFSHFAFLNIPFAFALTFAQLHPARPLAEPHRPCANHRPCATTLRFARRLSALRRTTTGFTPRHSALAPKNSPLSNRRMCVRFNFSLLDNLSVCAAAGLVRSSSSLVWFVRRCARRSGRTLKTTLTDVAGSQTTHPLSEAPKIEPLKTADAKNRPAHENDALVVVALPCSSLPPPMCVLQLWLFLFLVCSRCSAAVLGLVRALFSPRSLHLAG